MEIVLLETEVYLEDMGKGLILRTPVKEVVPVVAARQLLLAVHNTEKKTLFFISNDMFSSEDMCTK